MNRKMFEIYRPNEDGHAVVHIRWMMETQCGWVGAWDWQALSSLLSARKADAARVVEWATSKPRKAASLAFTEGPERDAAYWIEWAESRMKDAP